MKKLLIVLGCLVLMSALPALAQYPQTGAGYYYTDYYSNNFPGSAPDQIVRIINSGQGGTPLTAPTGNICANFYVFDNNQEMIECCSCVLTPNELASASVQTQLTSGVASIPLTGITPSAGVIKIVLTQPSAAVTSCDPGSTGPGLATANTNLGSAYATHAQNVSTTAAGPSNPLGPFTVTETPLEAQPLTGIVGAGTATPSVRDGEAGFLQLTCGFVRYLGSGRAGTCACTAPGL